MGITIHYRGTLDDVRQIETMEDRVLDLVFALGGRATVWRSYADHDRSRVVRGLIIEMEPGQDTFSLLVSPEGHLTSLFQIEDAEKAPFDKPPYCFVKTQFGSMQGHIAIVLVLDALQQTFVSNLQVSDEGEYYENRDVNELARKLQSLRTALSSMSDGLHEHGLTAEAAEDPDILATRIQRIAAVVHLKMTGNPQQPSQPAAHESDDDQWSEPALEDEVQAMDQLRRKNDLRSERMIRRISESTAEGMSAADAFERAMQEEGLSDPGHEAIGQDESIDITAEPDEPWIESLPPNPFDEASERLLDEKHPAVEQAQGFLMQVFSLAGDESIQSSFVSVLTRASMDILGSLVQATGSELDDTIGRALAISQLKRALSGHAYARGAVFGLCSEEAITHEHSTRLLNDLESLLDIIHSLAEQAWGSGN